MEFKDYPNCPYPWNCFAKEEYKCLLLQNTTFKDDLGMIKPCPFYKEKDTVKSLKEINEEIIKGQREYKEGKKYYGA